MTLKIKAETNYGDSEPCVAALSNKLFVGTENGFIASFNPDLSPATKWAAHEVQIFALAANDSSVFSASNDGNIRVFVFENNEPKAAYSVLEEVKDIKASDMIVTSLSAIDTFAWTGGWDGIVRRWKIADNKIEAAGEINLGCCVNALVATTAEDAYAILTGGRIVHVKSE
ncbi:unnamed protein product [Leptidea sinapis]|uniref:WD repeat-containing protein 55 homolog n=1 Tax=Leptidea sinapis TaxID=189913 RepID=A0A5E4R102_9NEOP|nr:unnamed protein product [Leptidea sinapis]